MTEQELKKFSRRNNRLAWKVFYPEENGKPKKGYVLHHKDPSLRKTDPIRYAEWRPTDLEMLTRSEHVALHNSLDPQRCSRPGEKNGMYGQGWKLQGERNGRFGLHRRRQSYFWSEKNRRTKRKNEYSTAESLYVRRET